MPRWTQRPSKFQFTDLALRTLKPALPGRRDEYRDANCDNLCARVTDRGTVTFSVMRRQANTGKLIRVTLGKFPQMSLAKAHEAAKETRAELATGVNRNEEKRVERARIKAEADAKALAAITFGDMAEDFIRRQVVKQKTARGTEQLIRRELVSRWGKMPVADVKRRDIIDMVEEIAEYSEHAAHQALIYAKRVFSWGIGRDKYGLDSSPATHVSARDLIGKLESRDRVLTDAELALIWQATGTDDPYDAFVRLSMLLGTRRAETAGMAHSEITGTVWHLTRERTKNSEARDVPLPPLALDIIAAQPRHNGGDYVLSTTAGEKALSGFSKYKRRLDAKLATMTPGGVPDWRIHDLRRTMRTGLAKLRVPHDIAELAIGHKMRGVAAVYNRHTYADEIRAAIEAWANMVESIVSPPRQAAA